MATLFVIRGRDTGKHFSIRGDSVTIGRESQNQIRLRDTEASRRHAVFQRLQNGNFEIVDNQSSNGTFVNSHRVTKSLLATGDRIQIGRTLLIFSTRSEGDSTLSQAAEIVPQAPGDDLSQIIGRVDGRLKFDASEAEVATGQGGADSYWNLLLDVGDAVSRTTDLDQLLPRILDLIFEKIACDRGSVVLLDEVTGDLRPTHSVDRHSRDTDGEPPIQISQTILQHVMSTSEGVLLSSANDPRWQQSESIADLRVSEAICVPMLGRYGQVGALYIDTEVSPQDYMDRNGETKFDAHHLRLLLAIANQAALAIEDTQFYRAMLQSERLAAMGQTIANLSHHVKNILQGISGGKYLVDDGLRRQNLETIDKGWSIVQRNQDRISNLVMDMLSFSKEREPNLQLQSVSGLVDEVGELLQSSAMQSGVRLSCQAERCNAWFDCEAIHRALLNVVSNAIDAFRDYESSEEPQVSVRASIHSEEQLVLIEVVDNGPGIEESDFERIFSPFESSKASRGTGLGLPVSRKILREHGGDVVVKSKVGKGTSFTLFWPVGDSDSNATQA